MGTYGLTGTSSNLISYVPKVPKYLVLKTQKNLIT